MKSTENQTQSQDAAAAVRPVSPARRRLLRGGLIGAPALLALKSTPVMACSCRLPSGFSVSGNLSNNQGLACSAPGKLPSYWKTHFDGNGNYNGSNCNKAENFSKYFTCGGSYTDKTLHTCVSTVSQVDHQAMAVACYVQGCSEGGSTFPLPWTIRDVWNQGVLGSGYPVPGSTAIWDKDKSIKYLKYLTGQSLTS